MLLDPDDVPASLRDGLREEVLGLREHGWARSPTRVYAGVPGVARVACEPVPEPGPPRRDQLDHDLRTWLAGTLLERFTRGRAPGATWQTDTTWETEGGVPVVWLTRDGTCTWHDEDAAWCGAVTQAAAELDLDVPFLVVTRHGWCDPRSGAGRRWARLRRRH